MTQYHAILVGNGTMGGRHRTRFEGCGVLFDKVLDVDAEKWLSENHEKLGVDFAVVASPASSHYDYVKFFLERKIPVLVEKPLAVTAEQALELVELSRSTDTLLFVAQSECYNPLFLAFRRHLQVDLRNAVAARAAVGKTAESAPLDVKLEFRREHGFTERCRDVDVSLDLLIHDVSLFLNLFDARDVRPVDENPSRESSADCRRIALKVVSGEFAGVEATLVANRNSDRDLRTVSVVFGRNGDIPGFDYSVSLARYTGDGSVVHLPDSLDNEHRFFLRLLAGSHREWAERALQNAAQSIALLAGLHNKNIS